MRNPDYWRGPNGITGEDLPYLDADRRRRGRRRGQPLQLGLRAGDFDVMMTSIGRHHQRSSSTTTRSRSTRRRRYGDTGVHHAERRRRADTDPEGKNAASPLLNVDCRRALAGGDRPRAAAARSAAPASRRRPTVRSRPARSATSRTPATRSSTSPTAQARDGQVPRRARRPTTSSSRFNTTNDPFNVETNTLIISMWTDAFGDKVQAKITPIEQGQYIGLALTGTFQAFGVAQPQRHRPRPAAAVVAERVGGADRRSWRSTSAASRTR